MINKIQNCKHGSQIVTYLQQLQSNCMKNKLLQFESSSDDDNCRQNPEQTIRASKKRLEIQFSSQSQQQQKLPKLGHSLRYAANSTQKVNCLTHSISSFKPSKKIQQHSFTSSIKIKQSKITTIGQIDDNVQQIIYLNHKQQQANAIKQNQTKKKKESLEINGYTHSNSTLVNKKLSNVFDIQLQNSVSSESFRDQQTGRSDSGLSLNNEQSEQLQQTETNILNPSQKIKKHCSEVIDYFMGIRDKQIFNCFLQRAIIEGMAYEFQIIQTKKIFQNSYQFCYCDGTIKHTILTAKYHNLHVKSLYMDILIDYSGVMHRIGRIKSDFQRNNFQILDGGNQPESKIYGHFEYSKNLMQKKANLFIPKTLQQSNQLYPFYTNSISNLLGELYKISSNKKNILQFSLSQLSSQAEWEVLQKLHSIQHSKRNLFLRDLEMGELKLAFGKLTKNKFKILCGSGLTPLLVFAIGVIVMQMN